MTSRTTSFTEIPGLEGVTVVRHAGPTPTDARHRHDSLCVGAVLAGERAVALDGATHAASAGEVLVIGPGRVHACPDRGESEYVMVSVPAALLESYGAPARWTAGPVLDDPALFGRVLALAELAERPAPVMERQAALLALLDGLAPGGGEDAAEPGPDPEPGRVRAARAHLEAHFAREVRLDDLARLAGCSPGRLNRAFALASGMPPHQYQTLLRVREVKRLLRGGASLADAALAAGFFDQSHMNRCFAKIMGMTPGTYARGLRPGRP